MGIQDTLKHAATLTREMFSPILGKKELGLPNGSVNTHSFFEVWKNGTIEKSISLNENNLRVAAVKNSLVSSILSQTSTVFAQVPLRVINDNTGASLPDSEIRLLLKTPTDWLSEYELKRLTMWYMMVSGNAYIHKVRNERGKILKLEPYSDAEITPVGSVNNYIEYYRYQNGSALIDISKEDIIHFRWPLVNPNNPAMGYSPLMALASEYGIDTEAARYIHALLKNDAMPRTVFTTPPDVMIGDVRRKELEEKALAAYGGENRGKPIFMDGGVTVHRLSPNLQELAVDALLNISESRICMMYMIPAVVAGAAIGLENSTYSNYSEARLQWVQNTMIPMWNMFAAGMEEGFRNGTKKKPDFELKDISLKHDLSRVEILKESYRANEENARESYLSELRTKNESRALIGLDPVKGGDVFKSPQQQPAVKAVDPVETKAGMEDGIMVYDETRAFLHYKAYDNIAEEYTSDISSGIASAFNKLEKRIAKQLNREKGFLQSKSLDVDILLSFWDDDFLKSLLQEETEESVKNLILAQLKSSVENVGASWQNTQTTFDKKIGGLLESSTDKIKESDKTVKAEIKSLLDKFKDAKPEQIAEALKNKFETLSESRANKIARTTATFATGASQKTAWDELGFTYTWLTQRDSKTRASHSRADGRKPDDEGYFSIGTDRMQHPCGGSVASENVNCRCVMIPVTEEAGKTLALFYDGQTVVKKHIVFNYR